MGWAAYIDFENGKVSMIPVCEELDRVGRRDGDCWVVIEAEMVLAYIDEYHD